jgi:hypothetical protein
MAPDLSRSAEPKHSHDVNVKCTFGPMAAEPDSQPVTRDHIRVFGACDPCNGEWPRANPLVVGSPLARGKAFTWTGRTTGPGVYTVDVTMP